MGRDCRVPVGGSLMPLYTYLCGECGGVTDRIVMGEKHPDPAAHTPMKCKHCGFSGALHPTLNAPQLKFKGIKGRSGFHSVDYPHQRILGTKTQVAVPDMNKGGGDA
jgi:predicted nucleic acid-binding Zn ribbon protein